MKFTSIDLLRDIAAAPEAALLDDPQREPVPVKIPIQSGSRTAFFMRTGPNDTWVPVRPKPPALRPEPQHVVRVHVEYPQTSPVLGIIVFLVCMVAAYIIASAVFS